MTPTEEDTLRAELVVAKKLNEKLREACIAGRGTLIDLRDRFTSEGTKYLTAYDNYDSFYQGMVDEAIDEMEEALT